MGGLFGGGRGGGAPAPLPAPAAPVAPKGESKETKQRRGAGKERNKTLLTDPLAGGNDSGGSTQRKGLLGQ